MKKFRSAAKRAEATLRSKQGAKVRLGDLAAEERRQLRALEEEGRAVSTEHGHVLGDLRFHAHRPARVWIAFCQTDPCYHALLVSPSRVPGYGGSATTHPCLGAQRHDEEATMTTAQKEKLDALKAKARTAQTEKKAKKGKRA